ncbi:hypothetical protein QCA50_000330 [Cerrena zonata]|uniref:Asl1-like glycosyl hydrolase catalytic domain-containing protein n=1 Tax=Cerrena zonata TaxID=2478898 RepID=A0AAW0GZW1_9APHY
MAATKLFQLIAFTALALIASSYGPTPVNALSTPHIHGRHHGVADSMKRNNVLKRDTAKRCKPRPSSSIASAAPTTSASPAPAPTTSSPAPEPTTTTKAATTTQSSSSSGSTSSSSSGTSTTPKGITVNGSSKLAMAWPNGDSTDFAKFSTNVQAYYTWSESCVSTDGGVPCMRMLWNNAADKVAAFKKATSGGPVTGKNIILGFNEVNEPGQANMSPEDACATWKDAIQPLAAKGYTLGAPCSSGNPNGITWMKKFFECCADCTIDFMTVHWYDIDLDNFKSWVQQWHDDFGNRDVMVTEFAVQNFNGGAQRDLGFIMNFHKEAAAWAKTQPWLKALAPFGVMRDMQGVNTANQLMNSDGSLTDLAWQIYNEY